MKYFFLFLFILASCKNKNNSNLVEIKSYKSDVFFKNFENNSFVRKKDTIIYYEIEGLSSEGAEAKATYKTGRVREIMLTITGSGGKCETGFHLENNKIKILDICYEYKGAIEDINSLEDMIISERKAIVIKKERKLSKDENEYLDLLLLLKKNMPFILTDDK